MRIRWRRWKWRVGFLLLGALGGMIGVTLSKPNVVTRERIEICPTTAYHWDSDTLHKGMKGYGKTFTGEWADANRVIAIDPAHWSRVLNLPWDSTWTQEQKALAPVFWKTIWIDADNHRCYAARDVGSKVRNNLIDISFGPGSPEVDRQAKLFGKQWRRFIIIVNDLPTPFYERTR